MDDLGFAVIGPGRVGLNLVDWFTTKGWRCVAVRGRRPAGGFPAGITVDTWSRPEPWAVPGLVLLTVPDRDIAAVGRRMAAELSLRGRTVLHTSGLHSASILEPCRAAGARIGSWHPLVSFATVPMPHHSWAGAPCAVEGDPEAVALGNRLALAVGLVPWVVPAEHKARYHAAAAVAANLSHVCIVAARELLSDLQIPSDRGSPLTQLVRAATEAALHADGLERLTGAIARGDRDTVARHLAALPDDLGQAYAALARWVASHADAEPH